jgi:hypothetical protein
VRARAHGGASWLSAATEPGNGEAAQPVLGDGEGGLRLPSSFSTDQLLRSVVENSNLVARGSLGYDLCVEECRCHLSASNEFVFS